MSTPVISEAERDLFLGPHSGLWTCLWPSRCAPPYLLTAGPQQWAAHPVHGRKLGSPGESHTCWGSNKPLPSETGMVLFTFPLIKCINSLPSHFPQKVQIGDFIQFCTVAYCCFPRLLLKNMVLSTFPSASRWTPVIDKEALLVLSNKHILQTRDSKLKETKRGRTDQIHSYLQNISFIKVNSQICVSHSRHCRPDNVFAKWSLLQESMSNVYSIVNCHTPLEHSNGKGGPAAHLSVHICLWPPLQIGSSLLVRTVHAAASLSDGHSCHNQFTIPCTE